VRFLRFATPPTRLFSGVALESAGLERDFRFFRENPRVLESPDVRKIVMKIKIVYFIALLKRNESRARPLFTSGALWIANLRWSALGSSRKARATVQKVSIAPLAIRRRRLKFGAEINIARGFGAKWCHRQRSNERRRRDDTRLSILFETYIISTSVNAIVYVPK
jgi:hypothetical protein